jgi:hypothetical protein
MPVIEVPAGAAKRQYTSAPEAGLGGTGRRSSATIPSCWSLPWGGHDTKASSPGGAMARTWIHALFAIGALVAPMLEQAKTW